MRLEYTKHCDVLVAGSGIAGIMAALAAAGAGRSVILASSGPVFSGSSFYPGTWGLGLIGPENEADQEDLVQSILEVGCGMADETMVRAFVAGIGPAIEGVKAMGVQLKAAADQNQKDFIPCFDRKHRSWNGLLFDSMRQVFSRKMEESGVEQLPGCELLQLIKTGERVGGAVICQKGELTAVRCGALVLATGGYGGLFRDRLTTDDVAGAGQWLALEAGAELVNLEFMQMMPGYLSPCRKTIFNEKTFRYTRLTGPDGRDILENECDRQALLECRSTHGPFTSRLASKRVDLAMVKAAQAAPEQKAEPDRPLTHEEQAWRNGPAPAPAPEPQEQSKQPERQPVYRQPLPEYQPVETVSRLRSGKGWRVASLVLAAGVLLQLVRGGFVSATLLLIALCWCSMQGARVDWTQPRPRRRIMGLWGVGVVLLPVLWFFVMTVTWGLHGAQDAALDYAVGSIFLSTLAAPFGLCSTLVARQRANRL